MKHFSRLFAQLLAAPLVLAGGTGAAGSPTSRSAAKREGFLYRLSPDQASYTVVEYLGTETDLSIPARHNGMPVTAIAAGVFRGKRIFSVSLPKSITSIGAYAFADCAELTAFAVPASCTDLGDGVLRGCTKLTTLTLAEPLPLAHLFAELPPKALHTLHICGGTSIPSAAFAGCTALETLTLPDTLTSVADHALAGCTALKTLTLPAAIESVGAHALAGCTALEKLTLPVTLKTVADHAFADCTKLKTLTLPASLATVGEYAFARCVTLESICLPASLTSLGFGAFADCTALKTVQLTSEQTGISYHAFIGCKSLDYAKHNGSLYLGSESNPYLLFIKAPSSYEAEGTPALSPNMDKAAEMAQVQRLAADGRTVSIHPQTRGIAARAFANCRGVRRIKLSPSLSFVGEAAFANCVSLLLVEDEVQKKQKDQENNAASDEAKEKKNDRPTPLILSKNAFAGCGALFSVTLDRCVTLGERAFAECRSLKYLSLAETASDIGQSAFFNCSTLTEATVGEVLSTTAFAQASASAEVALGDYAFAGCASLVQAYLGGGATKLGDRAFAGCTKLETLNLACATDFSPATIHNCTALRRLTVAASHKQYRVIEDRCLMAKEEGLLLCYFPKAAPNAPTDQTIALPTEVTAIGREAFAGCKGLKRLELSERIGSIAPYAFYSMADLTEVDLENTKIEAIPEGAFADCTRLRSVTLPATLTDIHKRAFYGAESLARITLPAGIKKICADAFLNCSDLRRVTLCDLEKWYGIELENKAANPLSGGALLYVKPKEEEAAAPRLVTHLTVSGEIKPFAFAGCMSLLSVTFKEAATIGANAFQDCLRLAEVVLPASETQINKNAVDAVSGHRLCESKGESGIAENPADGLYFLTLENGRRVLIAYMGEQKRLQLPAFPVGGRRAPRLRAYFPTEAHTYEILPHAFHGCTTLTSLVIPAAVTSICRDAFKGCAEQLARVHFTRGCGWQVSTAPRPYRAVRFRTKENALILLGYSSRPWKRG